ncbi:phage tail tip domain-containing protein [Escherichia coli]|nr:phage terminase large subunit family protein [Escherichia coli]MDO2679458.1 phage terminase large subunit family protein [Escherichia coli]
MNISEQQLNNMMSAVTTALQPLIRALPVTPVEWADQNYYLPKESSYGEGEWKTLPFQIAIMNSMGNDQIRTVNLIKSARVGYTKMLLGVAGYFIEHKSRNSLLFQPTDSAAEDFMKSHVEATIRDVPCLKKLSPWLGRKHRDNTITLKRFSSGVGFWCLGGAAAKNYREKSVDVVCYDELSSFEPDVEKEGSPTLLGDKRIEGSVWPKSIRGSQGLRHTPGDIIEICDNDYAGTMTGGRILSIDAATRTLTLDREVTLPETGTSAVNLINGSGKPVSVDITAHPAPDRIQVSTLPDGVETYGVWGLSLPSLRRRLFRCVSVRENTDGTFAITAVQHVPEKEAIVDNGARFEPQSGSLNSVIPPAVQHLTVEVSAADGQYLAQAKWDTPRVVKGVRFSLRLTSGSGEDSRLVTTAITADTEHRFSGLPLGEYTLTVRAINSYGQQGEPATTTFRINAPAKPATIELTPGYFQITAVPVLAVYDPTVQFEFWFSEKRITNTAQVEKSARYLGTGSQWTVSGPHIKPGKDFWFYVRSVNLVGKSAFVEASGRASNDAEGYLGLFREKIGKLHLAQGLWELIDNSQLADEMAEMKTTITETRNEITQTVSKTLEDQSATIQQIQRVQKDTNDDLAALYMLKVQKTKNGIPYVAGIGAGIEDTDGQPLSNILLLADRIAMINPEDGNTTPLFVAQGNQLFMNDVFLKRLFAVSITSSGNPPTFSLTPEGRLTARNADISGNVNANSGTLNNVTINENCRVLGKLSANQIEGDLVKTVGKAFPRDSRAPERWPSGTITVRVYDDQPFDRQIVIPAVAFSGAKHKREHTDIYSSCRLIVRKNGAEIYNRTALDNTLIYSGVIDMPAGHGHMTLEFSVSAWLMNNWYPTASISDLLVVVMKKATAGISIS